MNEAVWDDTLPLRCESVFCMMSAVDLNADRWFFQTDTLHVLSWCTVEDSSGQFGSDPVSSAFSFLPKAQTLRV